MTSRFHRTLLGLLCVVWLALTLSAIGASISDHLFFVLVFPMVMFGFAGAWWVAALFWLTVPVVASIVATMRLRAKRYRAAAAWATVPVLALVVGVVRRASAELAQFYLNKARYDVVVQDVKSGRCSDDDRRRWDVSIDAIECQAPILIVFAWGGFGSNWHGVVYDEADQISKPHADRSVTWRQRPSGSLLACSGAGRIFGPHYFRAGGWYSGAGECG